MVYIHLLFCHMTEYQFNRKRAWFDILLWNSRIL